MFRARNPAGGARQSDVTVVVTAHDASPLKKGHGYGVDFENGAARVDDGSFQSRFTRLAHYLHAPTHSSTIAVFRMLYALSVLAQLYKWDNMFLKFSKSILVLPYPGFSWIRPLSPEGGFLLISVCKLASFCQLIGFMTPVATTIAWFTFTWLFNICESNFNNHYILMCHMLFLGMFLQWGHWFSIDRLIGRWRGRPVDSHVPFWNLLLLRMIMTLPYLYGSFAKMNSDWLFRAEPVTMWFKDRGGLYSHPLFPWFICWTGMLFDLTIGFFLFYRPTRYLIGFPGALCFNFSNKIMFNIGVFPFMMVCSLTLFLEPNVPARIVSWITRVNVDESAMATKPAKPAEKTWHWGLTRTQWFGMLFVGCFLTFHSMFPFREKVMYPGNPSWHEEGHFGAWHMKLRTKKGFVNLNLVDSTGQNYTIDPKMDPFVHRSQNNYFMKPHCLILYVGRLKQIFEAAGTPLQSVMANNCFGLNSRPGHHLYKEDVNLLDFVGKYELFGVSGARQSPNSPYKWLWKDEEGPSCDIRQPSDARDDAKYGTRKGLLPVYGRAGIIYRKAPYSNKEALFWKDPRDGYKYAYLMPMIE